MILVAILIILTILACIWAFWLRPHFLTQPDHAELALKIRAIDAWAYTLWRNSRSVLVARLYVAVPVIVGVHDYIALNYPSLDLTPIWDWLFAGMPDSSRQMFTTLIAIGTGLLFEMLRRMTAPLPEKDA